MDMPISLALGTIRTPDFAVKDEAYAISKGWGWLDVAQAVAGGAATGTAD